MPSPAKVRSCGCDRFKPLRPYQRLISSATPQFRQIQATDIASAACIWRNFSTDLQEDQIIAVDERMGILLAEQALELGGVAA